MEGQSVMVLDTRLVTANELTYYHHYCPLIERSLFTLIPYKNEETILWVITRENDIFDIAINQHQHFRQ